jgi:2-phospho-L-lactate guanylyltransferase (CobY/MobA/RfbA family)
MLASLAVVLAAVGEAELEPTVLTADAGVAARVLSRARIRDEVPGRPGLNAQLEAAIIGLDDVLILHADLPGATASALRRVVEAGQRAPSLAMVRSTDGGTNVMRLRPPGGFALAYGRESFDQHLARALAAGYAVTEVRAAELTLDLDTPTDVATYLATAPVESPVAAYLRSLDLPERPGWPAQALKA